MKQLSHKIREFLSREENHYLRYTWILVIYLISFFILEQLIPVEACRPTDLPIDQKIPLIPIFVLPYIMWFPMLAGMALLLAICDHEAYKRYMVYIGFSFMCTLAIYVIIPTCQNLRPETIPADGLLGWIITQVYTADNNANVCPSLHVIGALAVCFAGWDAKPLRKPAVQLGIWIVTFIIAISTVFMNQHGIVDLAVAVPYSFGMYLVVYKLLYNR